MSNLCMTIAASARLAFCFHFNGQAWYIQSVWCRNLWKAPLPKRAKFWTLCMEDVSWLPFDATSANFCSFSRKKTVHLLVGKQCTVENTKNCQFQAIENSCDFLLPNWSDSHSIRFRLRCGGNVLFKWDFHTFEHREKVFYLCKHTSTPQYDHLKRLGNSTFCAVHFRRTWLVPVSKLWWYGQWLWENSSIPVCNHSTVRTLGSGLCGHGKLRNV